MTTGSPEQGELYQKTILPLLLAGIYLGLLNFAAFLSKKIAEKLWRRECLERTFLIQFIATIQICAGFYEEPVLKSVGDFGFFVFNFLNFYAAGVVPNALSAIERFTVKRKGNSEKMFVTFFAQLFGALNAPYMAVFIRSVMAGQTNRPDLVRTHAKLLGTGLCQWKFESQSFYVPLLTQFLLAAVMRFLLTSKVIRRRSLAVPVVYAAYFTFARAFIGFPGFDPIHSLARVSHCWLRGEFFVKWTLCYVFAPIFGWLLFSGSSKHIENASNETKRPSRRLRSLVEEAREKRTQEAPVGKVAKEAEEESKQGKVAIVRQDRVTRQDREPQRKFSNHQGRNHKKP